MQLYATIIIINNECTFLSQISVTFTTATNNKTEKSDKISLNTIKIIVDELSIISQRAIMELNRIVSIMVRLSDDDLIS